MISVVLFFVRTTKC